MLKRVRLQKQLRGRLAQIDRPRRTTRSSPPMLAAKAKPAKAKFLPTIEDDGLDTTKKLIDDRFEQNSF